MQAAAAVRAVLSAMGIHNEEEAAVLVLAATRAGSELLAMSHDRDTVRRRLNDGARLMIDEWHNSGRSCQPEIPAPASAFIH